MSNLSSQVERGYFLIADLSGYTSFLTQTELDHAQEILSDLLETILARLKTLLVIHKLEGDAVFAYVSEHRIVRGETLLELIEATYVDFRERCRNVRRHTTCTCRACQSIPMLDLKFVAHFGEFAMQNVGGVREMAGSDVNLVHRLLKNHISERTSWKAYAVLTHRLLEQTGLQPDGLLMTTESYEHLGQVQFCVMDLHARYDALMEARRVIVEPGEAVIAFSEELDAPPPVIWSWMNEPLKRALYTGNPEALHFIPVLRPSGRTGAGATTHCVHGEKVFMRERVLDWKPFDYFTVEQDSGMMGLISATFQLEEVEAERTRLSVFVKGSGSLWGAFYMRPLVKFIYTRLYDYRSVATRAKEVISGENARLAASGSLSGAAVT